MPNLSRPSFFFAPISKETSMFTVLFAATLAVVLLLLFNSTRALGAVGVFVLLCLEPIFFSLLLALCALAYHFLFRERRYEILPRGSTPSTERKRNILPVVALLIVGGAIGLSSVDPAPGEASTKAPTLVRSEPSEEVIVLRTSGGLLEVSRIEVTEVMDARFRHTLLGVKIGETVPRIRVPAVYRYHVKLDREWKVLRKDGTFTIVAPSVRPSLPVAVDFSGMEKVVGGSWMLQPITGRQDLDDLERSITAKLERKAGSREYLERQRSDARATIREFARKWIVEQTRWKDADFRDIRVYFADEPVRSIEALAG